MTTHEANQRLFDEALKHIRKQGKPSRSVGGRCVYRTEDGCGCAFAPAIADYTPEMEFRTAAEVMADHPERLHEWARMASPWVARGIQIAHDASPDCDGFLQSFESHMRGLADVHNLTYTPPEAAESTP